MNGSSLSGRHYAIVGATSGVGGSAAWRLIKEGASLLLLGRDAEKLAGIAREFPEERVATAPLDLEGTALEESMKDSFERYLRESGAEGFDGGVYCAGQAPLIALRATSQGLIESLLRVNFTGAALFSKLMAAKRIRHPARGASIVLIASVRACKGEVGLSLYGASKAALVASAKALAREIAPFGCRINCVSPGWLDTAMNRTNDSLAPGLAERMKELHPLGLGTTEDVAASVLFLLSDESRWITGTNLVVDGGFLA